MPLAVKWSGWGKRVPGCSDLAGNIILWSIKPAICCGHILYCVRVTYRRILYTTCFQQTESMKWKRTKKTYSPTDDDEQKDKETTNGVDSRMSSSYKHNYVKIYMCRNENLNLCIDGAKRRRQKDEDRRSNRTRENNKRADKKIESTDSNMTRQNNKRADRQMESNDSLWDSRHRGGDTRRARLPFRP